MSCCVLGQNKYLVLYFLALKCVLCCSVWLLALCLGLVIILLTGVRVRVCLDEYMFVFMHAFLSLSLFKILILNNGTEHCVYFYLSSNHSPAISDGWAVVFKWFTLPTQEVLGMDTALINWTVSPALISHTQKNLNFDPQPSPLLD